MDGLITGFLATWLGVNLLVLTASFFIFNILLNIKGKEITSALYQRSYYYHQLATCVSASYELLSFQFENTDMVRFFSKPVFRAFASSCYLVGCFYATWASIAPVRDGFMHQHTLRNKLKWTKWTILGLPAPFLGFVALIAVEWNNVFFSIFFGFIIFSSCMEIIFGEILKMNKEKHPMWKILKVLRYKPKIVFRDFNVYNGFIKLIIASTLFPLAIIYGWKMDVLLCILPTSGIVLSRILRAQKTNNNLWTPFGLCFKRKLQSTEVAPDGIVNYQEASSVASTPRATVRFPNEDINTKIGALSQMSPSTQAEQSYANPVDIAIIVPEPVSIAKIDIISEVVETEGVEKIEEVEDIISQISEHELVKQSPPREPTPLIPRKSLIFVEPAKDWKTYAYNADKV